MVEHHLAMVGVAGSNPVFRSQEKDSPLSVSFFNKREIAQLGRALRSGRRGRRFESCFPDKEDFAFISDGLNAGIKAFLFFQIF